MSKYTIPKLRKHWAPNAAAFQRRETECRTLFAHLAECGSLAIEALAGKKELEPNCAFLLLSKSLNHALSAQLLLEHGMMVDAALCARNAIEAMLLLELLVKQPDLCQQWSKGKEFKPADVRQRLEKLPRVEVRDIIIETSPNEHDDARFVYGWLSRITHANLESLNYSTSRASAANDFVIHIGGAHSPPTTRIVAASIGRVFARTVPCALGAYATSVLEESARDFERIGSAATALAKKANA